jgi:hypothetical protein
MLVEHSAALNGGAGPLSHPAIHLILPLGGQVRVAPQSATLRGPVGERAGTELPT